MSVLQSPDWFAIITDLIYAGVPMKEIARRLDLGMSGQLLRHYRAGGQPLYVRGEALIQFWADQMGKSVLDLPRKPFVRGHRVARKKL